MLWIRQSNDRMLQYLCHFYAHVIFEGAGLVRERVDRFVIFSSRLGHYLRAEDAEDRLEIVYTRRGYGLVVRIRCLIIVEVKLIKARKASSRVISVIYPWGQARHK